MVSTTKTSFIKSPLVLLFAPTLVMLAIYYLLVVPTMDRDAAKVGAKAMALAEVERLDTALQGRKLQISTLARDSNTLDALLTRDVAAIRLRASYWRENIDQSTRLLLLPYDALGHAGMGELGDDLENNIERDLVSRAVKEGQAVADVYFHDVAQRLIFAAPIYSEAIADVIGVVFVELSPVWLHQLVNQEPSLDRDDSDAGTAGRGVRLVSTTPKRQILTELKASLSDDTYATLSLSELDNVVVEAAVAGKSVFTKLLGLLLAITGAAVAFAGLALPARREAVILQKAGRDAEAFTHFATGSLRETLPTPNFELDVFGDMANSVKQGIARYKVDSEAKGSIEQQVQTIEEVDVGSLLPELDESSAQTTDAGQPVDIPASIFRAYDIRGHATEELNDAVVLMIGRAFGSQLIESGENVVALGCDSRHSSPRIAELISQGLQESGCAVVDLGLVPTPLLYFSGQRQANGNAVMVTGSHNPAEENGFKFVQQGAALADDDLKLLEDRVREARFVEGDGSTQAYDCIDDYVDVCADDVVFASPVKVVVDCCNGAASEVAPILYAALGAEVIPLFAEPDGDFPNHPPLPVEENLGALIAEVKNQGADLGLAFDGDADRVVAVTGSGEVVKSDQLLMLFARDVLTRNPGADIVFDIKCTRHLNSLIAGFGGRPVIWKSGHSRIKKKMRETGALLGGEFSGHFFFNERWFGFDDGLYAGARLIELLTLEAKSLAEALADLPMSTSTDEILIPVAEQAKFALIDQLQAAEAFSDAEVNAIDGLRVEYADGWGLLRASNTSAALTARFEADNPEALQRIAAIFSSALKTVDPALQFEI